MVIVLAGVSVVVVLLLIGAFLIPSGGGSPQSGQTSQTTDPTALGTTVPDAQLTSFKDDATGFSVKYPKEWTKVDSGDPNVPLILSFGQRDGVRVRLERTEVATNAENIANIKAFTDGVVGQNKTAKVLQQRQVAVDNMPGYYYLYTFVDQQSGAEGVHAHYFLFRGKKLYTVVLQALPSEGFPALAPAFDQVIESIHTTPDLQASTPPASTPGG
ncbi:MAG: PsbP [Actinomycetota bacterium]|jgi:hypothetical protein|nr:PsbP [Actinomycetota bacterium]MEA2843524.1 PsbP [Actinomycetota bacterium]